MSISNDVFKMSTQVAMMTATITEKLADALVNYLKSRDEHASYKYLFNHMEKGGKLEVVFTQDKIYEKFMKPDLDKAGIVTVPYQMMVGDGKVTEGFLFTAEMRERVEQVRMKVLIEQGLIGVVSKEDLLTATKGDKLCRFHDVDRTTAKIIAEEASMKHFSVAFEETNGKYSMLCLPKHKDAIAREWFVVEYAKRQSFGKHLEERATFELANENRMGQYLNDKEKEFVIAEEYEEYPYLEIMADSYRYHYMNEGKEEIEQVLKTDKEYQEKLAEKIQSVQNMVVMNREHFQVNLHQRNLELKKEYGKPHLSKTEREELKAFKKKNREIQNAYDEKHRKVEMKLAFFDNREQREHDSAITNDFVNFTEFYAHKVVNDQHELEENIRIVVSEIKGEIAGHRFDVIDVEPGIDFVIEKAMDKSKEKDGRLDTIKEVKAIKISDKENLEEGVR